MAANRIKGITIEIGGDTTKLQTALKGVNTEVKNGQYGIVSTLAIDYNNVGASVYRMFPALFVYGNIGLWCTRPELCGRVRLQE